MAMCPKCQLPNPDTAETCIWCGQHRFEQGADRLLAATVSPAATVDARPGETLLGSSHGVPVMVAPQHPSALVASFTTPTTPAPEQKSLPSHLELMFARATSETTADRSGGLPAAPPTVAEKTGEPAPTHSGDASLSNPAASTVPAITPPPQIRPKLVVLRGQKISHEYPVYEGRNVIGRFADKPVDIDLVAQEAEGQIWSSRQHAAITFDKNLLLVEDLNSLNGTWVNGTRLYPGQPRPLKPNDVIQIGTVQLKVVII